MCYIVHMKTISIRELHLDTGKWVRHAAEQGPVVVTDRGRKVAELQPYEAPRKQARLPDREAKIKSQPFITIDSVVYQQDDRDRA
ncbi:MAG: type II toxin-antitoxin system Phd/YefM family antitoxin [Acidobacteria bacterium]|nr:MAG: type II toxin-antitoxin system Phd/YefM family antitoxin [Acidobacteriota bacterium]